MTPDTYNRLKEVVYNPEEYLNGKICDYYQLNRIDGYFLSSLDKDYAIDYFLIKDWTMFSIYKGNLIDKIIQTQIYKEIPIKTIQYIWNIFNENKKELQTSQKQYYQEKRYQYIPKLATFLLTHAKLYSAKDLLSLLIDMVENLKEEKHDYYLARNCAKLMGDYLKNTKDIDVDILEFLKQQQDLKDMQLYLIFYDWQIEKIYKKDKLDIIFKLLEDLKPEIKHSEIIQQALDKNAFHIIKYMHYNYHYEFSQNELEEIFKKQLTAFNKENTQFIIEHFKPSNLVEQAYKKIYYENRYSLNQNEIQAYKNNIDYLQKKVAHELLNERLPSKQEKQKVNKI